MERPDLTVEELWSDGSVESDIRTFVSGLNGDVRADAVAALKFLIEYVEDSENLMRLASGDYEICCGRVHVPFDVANSWPSVTVRIAAGRLDPSPSPDRPSTDESGVATVLASEARRLSLAIHENQQKIKNERGDGLPDTLRIAENAVSDVRVATSDYVAELRRELVATIAVLEDELRRLNREHQEIVRACETMDGGLYVVDGQTRVMSIATLFATESVDALVMSSMPPLTAARIGMMCDELLRLTSGEVLRLTIRSLIHDQSVLRLENGTRADSLPDNSFCGDASLSMPRQLLSRHLDAVRICESKADKAHWVDYVKLSKSSICEGESLNTFQTTATKRIRATKLRRIVIDESIEESVCSNRRSGYLPSRVSARCEWDSASLSE